MKKLFLFILILFGMINIKGLAAGCNAQVCMCPGGGYVTTGQYCPVYNQPSYSPDYSLPKVWFSFSYDSTRKSYGIGEGKDKKTSESESLKNCGSSECKVIKSVKEHDKTLLIALSSNNIMEFKSFNHYFYDKSTSYYEDLLKKCKDKGGIDCKVVFNSRILLHNSKAYEEKFGRRN